MCDYCGCRDVGPIGELSREHDEIQRLRSIVRRSLAEGNHQRARSAWEEMIRLLEAHVGKEELGLFSAMAEEGDFRTYVESLRAEHRTLHREIEVVGEGPVPAEAVTALLDMLDAHIYKEEWDLFPAAIGVVPAGRLHEISRIHADYSHLETTGQACEEVRSA